jgi:CHAT domain-containing protein
MDLLFIALAVSAGQSNDKNGEDLVDQADRRMTKAIASIRKNGKLADVKDDLTLADAEFTKAAALLSAGGKHNPRSTFALLRSADCRRIMQRWNEAKDRYQEVVRVAGITHEVEFQAKAWIGLGKLERFGLKNQGAAAAAIEQAIRLTGLGPNYESLHANALLERADLESASGDNLAALRTLGTVVEAAQRLADKDLLQPALFSQGGVKQGLAESLYAIYLTLPLKTPREWKRCEDVERSIRQYLEDAVSDLKNSRKLAEEMGFGFISASIDQELVLYGPLLSSVDKTVETKKKAYEEERRAKAVAEGRSGLTANSAKIIDTDLLGPALPPMNEQQQRQFAQDIQSLSKAGGSTTVNWRQRYMEGQLHEAQGQMDAALDSYREAAKIVDEERRTLPTDVSRGLFAAERSALYDRLFLNLLKLARETDAFHWVEQLRARATTDLLSSSQLRFPSEQERRLYAELMTARAENAAALNDSGDAGRGNAKLAELMEQIRKEAPSLLELVDAQPVTFDELRAATRETPFDLVYYFLHQGRVIVWHIGPAHSHVRAYFAPASELLRLSGNLKDGLLGKSAPFDDNAAKDLYSLLIAPMSRWVETNHLVIIPAPELQGLPFQALLDETDGKFLGEKVAISYTPSASVAVRLRSGSKLEGAKVLTVIGPNLEHAEAEAAAVAANYPHSQVLRGSSATRSALIKQVNGQTVVHFAAHGEFNEAEPMLSFVQLAAEPGHNGQLTAAEMFELPLRGTSLVTLSACEAAKVRSEASNDVYGITRSMLYAGAQDVLLPLWKVDDEATALWMTAFYREAQSNTPSKAMMLANQEILKHPVFGSHPKYWAAFVLIGR